MSEEIASAPRDPMRRLALHLTMTQELLAVGCSRSMLQQQLVGLRSVMRLILDDESDPGGWVQADKGMAESTARFLAQLHEVPDDLSGWPTDDLDR